jgi:hypothetical protein
MLCPRCRTQNLHRVQRKGFFQLLISTIFGFYPWHCTECKQNCLKRKRHERRTHSNRSRQAPPSQPGS